MDREKQHGRDTTWILRAREAPEHIKENWPGCSTGVGVRDGVDHQIHHGDRQPHDRGIPIDLGRSEALELSRPIRGGTALQASPLALRW
jgi:hypothetical protein